METAAVPKQPLKAKLLRWFVPAFCGGVATIIVHDLFWSEPPLRGLRLWIWGAGAIMFPVIAAAQFVGALKGWSDERTDRLTTGIFVTLAVIAYLLAGYFVFAWIANLFLHWW